ncbi:hypothetical protein DMI70_12250 [Escherichia coli]|nr:hypothetical protein [Escherichia coli]
MGIWFRFATDARLKIEVIEFYDDQSGYERGLTLPLRHPSGLRRTTEAVWGLNTAYSVVEKRSRGTTLPHRHGGDDDRVA